MAKKEIIVERLPALVADRAEPLKLETAIRYVGNIIFDATQDPAGEMAAWLSDVLSHPSSPQEVDVRDAILTLLREGSLERYAQYSAWVDVARAGGFLPEPVATPPSDEPPASADTPTAAVIDPAPSTPNVTLKAGGAGSESARVVTEAPIKLMRAEERPAASSNSAIVNSSKTSESHETRRASDQSRQNIGQTGQPCAADIAPQLQISSAEGLGHDPAAFAEKFRRKAENDLFGTRFARLSRFVPGASLDRDYIEWRDPSGAGTFRDYGDRLTCGSPNSEVVSAMLELGTANDWARIRLSGRVNLSTLLRITEADDPIIGTQHDDADPLHRIGNNNPGGRQDYSPSPTDVGERRVRSEAPTAGLPSRVSAPRSRIGHNAHRIRRVSKLLIIFMILAGFGFAGSYIYSNLVLLTGNDFESPAGLGAGGEGHISDSTGKSTATVLTAHPHFPLGTPPPTSFRSARLAAFRRALNLDGYSDVQFKMMGDTMQLSGSVPDSRAHIQVETVANNIVGVTSFDDHIRVRGVKTAEPNGSTNPSLPLQLTNIEFFNTTRSGTPLSGPKSAFNASKVRFVSWRVTFLNRLHKSQTKHYRVDAAYFSSDGHSIGSADDTRVVPPDAETVIFTGRAGNSAGGAFLPGWYTVKFYLDGAYVAEKRFRVIADSAWLANGSSSSSRGFVGAPVLAMGTIDGLGGSSNIPIELRLRPQPNGFLHGELVIHEAGYGATPIQGFARGDHLEFNVPYGSKTLYFDGQRSSDQISGTFSATPSGEHGTWSTTTGGRSSHDVDGSAPAATCKELAGKISGKYLRRGFNKDDIDWVELRSDGSCELSKNGAVRALSKCSWKMSDTEPCKITMSWQWQEPSKYEDLFNQLSWEILPSDPALLRGAFGNGAFQKQASAAEPATRLVEFRPTTPNGSPINGSCWTGSIASSRPGAWRCSADNRIHDPCFSVTGKPGIVVCQNTPFDQEAVAIRLTKPLPLVGKSRCKDCVWALQLADGSTCTVAGTGTLLPLAGDVERWGCSNPSCSGSDCPDVGIVGKLETGTVWMAHKVTFRWSHGAARVLDRRLVAVRKVWK